MSSTEKKSKPSLVMVSRGRNHHANMVLKKVASSDVFFDYRGTSRLLFWLKALITATEIPKSKYLLAVGGMSLTVAIFRQMFSDCKVIFLNQEPFFIPAKFRENKISTYIKKKLFRKFTHSIITVSIMSKEDALRYFPEKPVESVNFFIDDEYLEKDAVLKRTKNVYYIIARPLETGHTKGADVAIELARKCFELDLGITFHFVGQGTQSLTNLPKNIVTYGHVESMTEVIKGGVIISPSRYDAYNLSITEGIMLGCMPMVSEYTGCKELLEDADFKLGIIDYRNVDSMVERLKEILFGLSDEEAVKHHQNLVNEVKKLSLTQCRDDFNKILDKMLED